MSKLYLGAFVCLTATAAVGVDYVNQSRMAGMAAVELGPVAYLGTLKSRFVDTRSAMEAKALRDRLRGLQPRKLLPEPPEGWTRRDYAEADIARLEKRYDIAGDAFVPDALKNDPTMKMLSQMNDNAVADADAREVYVYEKDDALIALRLKRRRDVDGMAGVGLKMVEANLNAMSSAEGFAMVGGVAYRDNFGLFGSERAPDSPRIIIGRLGDELEISLRTRADVSDDDILALLTAIDYDQLNASLETPLAGIGNAVPTVDRETSRAMAEAQTERENDALRERGKAAEAQLMNLATKINDDKSGLTAAGAALGLVTGDAGATVPEGMSAPKAAEAPGQALSLQEATAGPASGGGGFFGSLSKLWGGGTSKPGQASVVAKPSSKADIKISRGAGDGCTQGIGKRCAVGN
ncbi:MAG: hypothetical protein H6895_07115 [Defluviimonas sp.]|uniref:hypothetical protein n=1 Tax=Albidovulum sp. TaxID=1872424 RepID=UPI001D5DB2E3|nr:hypothetical protein [Paracoccaceae bacterium]MCC0063841.1 hypothetical protein [Defluviimonas sp.]